MGLTCNACNTEFEREELQRQHYRSGWHRYNLKRKVAGIPGVTEALYIARQEALAEGETNVTPMLYHCSLCGKQYRSSEAHRQHLNSRAHALKASQEPASSTRDVTVIKVLTEQAPRKTAELNSSGGDDEDEWEVVDPDEDLDLICEAMFDDELVLNSDDDMGEFKEVVPSDCFMCDVPNGTVESCIVHMHKKHGFFIPDIEYLKDPIGLLTYVGLMVRRDFMCLHCSDRCQPFQSLEAVRKHMDAKGHCKLRYGDGLEGEDADLEVFYDYSSSYEADFDAQLLMSDDADNGIELGIGGSELLVTQKAEKGVCVKALGSREYLRYYRQKPRPATPRDTALAIAMASNYRSMSLATVQSRKKNVRMRVLRKMNRRGAEAMRSEIGMKGNVIKNLPKNVPY